MKLNLGANIRNNRRRLELTQEQLADRLGVSFQSISRWETGTTYPDMELLPEMAKLFSVTVDELLGYSEPEEKIPYREIEDALGDALKENNIEESVRLIRLIRLEYLDDVYCHAGCISLSRANLSDACKHPEIIAEVRRLTEDYLRLGKGGHARSSLIEQLVNMIDDGHLEEVLGLYSTEHADLSRDRLLLGRYRYLGEKEKLAELEWIRQYEHMNESFEFRRAVKGDNGNEYVCQVAENRLELLHAMNRTIPGKAHPLTGDGSIDIWAAARLRIGYYYIIHLSAAGRTEEALIALEDFTELMEKLVMLPNGTEISCRSPMFQDFVLKKKNSSDKTAGNVILVHFETPSEQLCRVIYVSAYRAWIGNPRIIPGNEFTLSWLTPLREEPRYLDACRRLEECLRTGVQPDDINCIIR